MGAGADDFAEFHGREPACRERGAGLGEEGGVTSLTRAENRNAMSKVKEFKGSDRESRKGNH
jgi:hypothetical protein